MDKLIQSIEKHLVPLAAKLNGQRHLAALRDGFIAIMPFMIVGAFAVMINSVFLDFSSTGLIGSLTGFTLEPDQYPAIITFLKDIMVYISNGSLNIIGILAVFTIAYSLTTTKGYNGLEAAVIAVGAFFISLTYGDATLATSNFGSGNLITAILIAFFTGELYTFCLKRDFRIKMPDTVPPAVSRSFSALIPAALVVIIVATLQVAIVDGIIPTPYLAEGQTSSISIWVQNMIGVPLHIVGGGFFGMLVYALMTPFLWFFGIHGPNTMAFLDQTLFTPAAITNGNLIQSGYISFREVLDPAYIESLPLTAQPTMYTKTLVDSFLYIGGCGTTLGLVIALLIGSKDKAARSTAKYSLAPAFFNINEPLIFGLPIVFNPILFVPFIIIQPILLFLTTVVINIGLIPMYSIPIPWTSPVGIGAFLGYGGSIAAFIWAFVCLFIAVVVYYPFVVAMNRASAKEAAMRQENPTGSENANA